MKITESSNMPPIHLVALGKMLGDDPSLVQMILGKFRAEIPSLFEHSLTA